jgi:hypothetical protein
MLVWCRTNYWSYAYETWSSKFGMVRELTPPVSISAMQEKEGENLSAQNFLRSPFTKRRPIIDKEDLFVEVDEFVPNRSAELLETLAAVEDFTQNTHASVGERWTNIQRSISQNLSSEQQNSAQPLKLVLSFRTNIIFLPSGNAFQESPALFTDKTIIREQPQWLKLKLEPSRWSKRARHVQGVGFCSRSVGVRLSSFD